MLVRGLCAFHEKSPEGEKKGATETEWAKKVGRNYSAPLFVESVFKICFFFLVVVSSSSSSSSSSLSLAQTGTPVAETYAAVRWRFQLHRAVIFCLIQCVSKPGSALRFWWVWQSHRNSGSSMDGCRCTPAVLLRAVDLLPHRCVSRPSFCPQILVDLRVLQELR